MKKSLFWKKAFNDLDTGVPVFAITWAHLFLSVTAGGHPSRGPRGYSEASRASGSTDRRGGVAWKAPHLLGATVPPPASGTGGPQACPSPSPSRVSLTPGAGSPASWRAASPWHCSLPRPYLRREPGEMNYVSPSPATGNTPPVPSASEQGLRGRPQGLGRQGAGLRRPRSPEPATRRPASPVSTAPARRAGITGVAPGRRPVPGGGARRSPVGGPAGVGCEGGTPLCASPGT